MSEQGSAGTSMRRVASACGLNVATIYHYFPSKADLLRAVIEERRYGERLAAQQDAPIDMALDPPRRLVALLEWVWEQAKSEHQVLRLLLGEGVRGDATAQHSTQELIGTLDAGLADWVGRGFPELAAHGVDMSWAARVIRRQFIAVEVEYLATGVADPRAAASELASMLFPTST